MITSPEEVAQYDQDRAAGWQHYQMVKALTEQRIAAVGEVEAFNEYATSVLVNESMTRVQMVSAMWCMLMEALGR